MTDDKQRLVVVSNRLPVALKKDKEDNWTVTPGAGGLVTALAPVLQDRGGVWVGWSGADDSSEVNQVLESFSSDAGYELRSVPLTAEEVDGYYYGFANEIIWPLFHDFQSRCNFSPEHWRTYLDVNLKFGEVVARYSSGDDFLWVHDYHLMHLAFMLRNMGVPRKTGFFLHIPFPPPDIFLKLPWRAKIVRALLEYDLVGFHTWRDTTNFMHCVRALAPETQAKRDKSMFQVSYMGRKVRVGSFPISIDFESFDGLARSREVQKKAKEFRSALKDRTVILGVDRLDYTKGIPERIKAVRHALVKYPELHDKISFVQLAVPSRAEIPEYNALKTEIEQLVGEVNGKFGKPGWVPVHYLYRSLPREELVAYYLGSDMALVSPLKDGMNLVAKEYCASHFRGEGTLLLSEFAGAAAQLQNRGATLINPYDIEGTAKAIRKAYYMEDHQRKADMRRLRASIRRQDIFWWLNSFLNAAVGRQLNDFSPRQVEFS